MEFFIGKNSVSWLPSSLLSMEVFVILFIGVERSSCLFVTQPEWNAAHNDMSNSPSWVPWFWMIISDGQANFFVWLEGTIVHCKHNIWWSSWIVLRTNNFTKVVTTFIVSIKVENYEIPGKWVFWIWSTNVIVSYLSMFFNLVVKIFLNFFAFSRKSHIGFLHICVVLI